MGASTDYSLGFQNTELRFSDMFDQVPFSSTGKPGEGVLVGPFINW